LGKICSVVLLYGPIKQFHPFFDCSDLSPNPLLWTVVLQSADQPSPFPMGVVNAPSFLFRPSLNIFRPSLILAVDQRPGAVLSLIGLLVFLTIASLRYVPDQQVMPRPRSSLLLMVVLYPHRLSLFQPFRSLWKKDHLWFL